MQKHMEDNAEFHMLIDDSGGLVAVCSQCKKKWTGKLTLAASPTSVRQVRAMFETARRLNPSLLKDMGVDVESSTAI